MSPGVLAYYHWANDWPPLYASMAEMSYVDGVVLEHMMYTHGEYRRRVEAGDTNAARDAATRCVEGLQKLLGVPQENNKEHGSEPECIAGHE